MGNTSFRKVILASALLAWGCSSGGDTGGNGGSGGSTSSGQGGSSATGKGGSETSGNGGTTGAAGSPATTGKGGTTSSGNGGAGGMPANTGEGGTTGDAGGPGTGKGGSVGPGQGGKGGGTAGSGSGVAGTTGTGGGASGGSTGGGTTVSLDKTHQKIQGFGINDNWGQQFSSSDADLLFNTSGTGIGLTILRTGMSDGGAFYNSFESSNISALKSRAGSDAKLIGSVWSPPANCKDNNNVNDGGHLKSSCYDSWSTTIANFAGSNGFYAMSIGNEPDFASCGSSDPCNGNYPTTLATAKEMVAWVKVAGPKLQAKGVKVITPEASEWLHNWSNVSAGPDVAGKESSDPLKCGCFPDKNTNSCASTCTMGNGYDYGHWLFMDTAAWAAFDIMGVHQYDSQVAMPWPADVNGGKPNKEVWQTEMSGVKWWPEQGPSSDIANGIAVAGWIHSALVDGEASAWLYWWYKAYNTDDNEGLLLKNGNDTRRHWTFGNYSKFVRPGYTRVEVAGAPSGVLISAFKGADGTLAIVAINKNASAVSVPITISGGTAPAMLTPNVTSMSDNLKAGTAVAVSGGSFTAMLAASTVTTFVGK